MLRKIFFICLAVLLGVQGAASAKNKGLPEEERIKVAVEIKDTSRHKELDTAQNLETFLRDKLVEKNLLNIVDTKVIGESNKAFDNGAVKDEDVTADKQSPAPNFGELLIFDAVELPAPSDTPENFRADAYKEAGAAYVIRCEVLALGTTKVEDKTLSTIFSALGTATAFAGSGNKSRDKTLRRIGLGIGLGGFIETKRTALNTVVNLQFISVKTGQILWQEHFTGQAVKHRKPSKEYDDAWTQAYIESVQDSAKRISKRVNKYVDKVIIKGKTDKSFLPPGLPGNLPGTEKFSFGGGIGIGKLF